MRENRTYGLMRGRCRGLKSNLLPFYFTGIAVTQSDALIMSKCRSGAHLSITLCVTDRRHERFFYNTLKNELTKKYFSVFK